MPVAISPVNGQPDGLLEFRDQGPIVIVNGAASVKVIIMFRDGKHPFPGYVPAPQNVFEKGDHIFMFFGATEGNYQ